MRDNGTPTGHLEDNPLDNVGLRMKATTQATHAPTELATPYTAHVTRLQGIHDKYETSVKEIQASTAIPADGKELLIGEISLKHQDIFDTALRATIDTVGIQGQAYEKGLKHNNVSLGNVDVAMMGLVAPRITEGSTDFLRDTPVADNVANALASFGLLDNTTKSHVQTYLDDKYTASNVEGIAWVKDTLDTLVSVSKSETRMIERNTPSAEKMTGLRASKEIKEAMKQLSFGA